DLQRRTELDARVALALLPAQPFAVEQPGPGVVERPVVPFEQGQRLREAVLVTVDERPAAMDNRRCPGPAASARPRLEKRQGLRRRLRPADPYSCLDQVWRGAGG